MQFFIPIQDEVYSEFYFSICYFNLAAQSTNYFIECLYNVCAAKTEHLLIYSRFVLMHLPGKITYKERGSAKSVFHTRGQSPNLQTFKDTRNRFQGTDSVSLCSLNQNL